MLASSRSISSYWSNVRPADHFGFFAHCKVLLKNTVQISTAGLVEHIEYIAPDCLISSVLWRSRNYVAMLVERPSLR